MYHALHFLLGGSQYAATWFLLHQVELPEPTKNWMAILLVALMGTHLMGKMMRTWFLEDHFGSIMQEKLPPTDSRLRPDQRCLKNGEYEMANAEKLSLEQRQQQGGRIFERDGIREKGDRRSDMFTGKDKATNTFCLVLEGDWLYSGPNFHWRQNNQFGSIFGQTNKQKLEDLEK